MSLDAFCIRLSELHLNSTEIALAILWFHDEKQPDISLTAGELSGIITRTGLGVPHSTRLAIALRKSGHVLESQRGFRLKVLSRTAIRKTLEPILAPAPIKMDHQIGYLPGAVWENTRGYVEEICGQINCCYQFELYDAAAVLLRRIVETLIIESFEALKRSSEIKDGGGNYFMLRDLASRASGTPGLSLGRNAKQALDLVKEAGDLAAHNRRYLTKRTDMDRIQMGSRVLVEELMVISGLRR